MSAVFVSALQLPDGETSVIRPASPYPPADAIAVAIAVKAVLLHYDIERDCCILASALMLAALRRRRCKLDAWALPTRMHVFNQAAAKLLAQDSPPPIGPAWDAVGAWSIGLGEPGSARAAARDLWVGHLVVIVQRQWLFDLTLDQADRPEKNLRVPSLVITPVHERWLRDGGGKLFVQFRPEATVGIYSPEVQNKAYRTAPDWHLDQDKHALINDAIDTFIATGRLDAPHLAKPRRVRTVLDTPWHRARG